MSSPAQQPAVTEDIVRAIWAGHGLGPVTRIARPSGGVRNLCFFVNDDCVLRFDTHERGSKFLAERLAYDLLARQALPVPQMLVLDDSLTLAPYAFAIATRLPGQNLAGSWQALPADQLRALVYEIGQCLARIHACTFPAFGRPHVLNHTSWAGYVREYVEPHLRSACDAHLLGGALRTGLERALDRALSDFGQVAQPALIHCDFHYENILHVDGRLSGLLDFEWSLAGDPAYDFAIDDVRERMVPQGEAALVAGYRSIRSFGPNHSRHVRWYQIILRLGEVVTSHHTGDSQGTAAALARLRQLVG